MYDLTEEPVVAVVVVEVPDDATKITTLFQPFVDTTRPFDLYTSQRTSLEIEECQHLASEEQR